MGEGGCEKEEEKTRKRRKRRKEKKKLRKKATYRKGFTGKMKPLTEKRGVEDDEKGCS